MNCLSLQLRRRIVAAYQRGEGRPSEQLRRDVEDERAAFLDAVKTSEPDRLIFIDESGCNIALGPTYGRAPRGQRVIDHKPANWGKNISIVGAVRADRVLAHQTFDGAVNGPKFIEFVRHRLVPRLYPGDVVVLDTFALITRPKFVAWSKVRTLDCSTCRRTPQTSAPSNRVGAS